MSCCGGSCCGGGKPWGLVAVVFAAAVGGAVTFMARDGAVVAGDSPVVRTVRQPGQPATAGTSQPAGETDVTKDPAYVLGYTMKLIDGADKNLADYTGKVVVFVNVASKCGMTPQYEALEKLYAAKKDSGLVILGFPANNFGGQEPGTNKDIAEFCRETYDVRFPMFEKISVLGDDQHPLYKRLAAQPAPVGEAPTWNFTKFVADKSGRVVARFGPKVSPDAPDFVARIDELLAAK